MNRFEYYQKMKELALQKRTHYSIDSPSLGLRTVRDIYKAEGIRIDLWDIKGSRLRAAYFCDENDFSVLINSNLPREPRLFSLVHELKHHYVDRESLPNGQIKCGDYNASQVTEIGAEVFAAEFIYPETEMRELAGSLGITRVTLTPNKVVEFKRLCPATVSYQFILKRFERFGFCRRDEYQRIQFRKLEEQIYGVPIYKREWFRRHRARKAKLRVSSRTLPIGRGTRPP